MFLCLPLGGEGVVVCFWLFLHITDVPADEDTVCFWLVGMCVVGLLFENYIVNASIFIRSNFLEIIEPGSDMTLSGVVTVFMVLSKISVFDLLWSSF